MGIDLEQEIKLKGESPGKENDMDISIKDWKKVKAGAYDSDVETFDWEEQEYCALYQIKYDSRYKWYDMFRVESSAEKQSTKLVNLGYEFTLKEAKAFCERHMGVVRVVDGSSLR